jgi:phage tail sheath protein FI
MTTHGVTIDRLTGGIRPVETVEGAAIGVLASATELTEGDLALITSATDMETIDDGTGTITPFVNAVRRHSQAPIVLNVVAPLNLADATGSAATHTMAYRFLQAEAELGVRPRILAQNLVGEVESDLIAVGDRLLSAVFLDGPNSTDALAITGVASVTSQRAGYSDPAFIDDNDDVIGSSTLYAAIASTLNFWEAVSNKPVLGVKALSRPIGFTMGDANSQAQLLNAAKINTIIRKNGWRLWGGLSTSADAQFKFLNVARTDDVIAESIQEAFLWAVDMGITKTFVEDVVESVKGFLRDLQARGAIIGGTAWADKSLNTPSSVMLGNLYIDYEFTPVYPAHSIVMRRHITHEYLTSIFG